MTLTRQPLSVPAGNTAGTTPSAGQGIVTIFGGPDPAPALTITAHGEPKPQGSKTMGRTFGGKPIMREANKGTKPWRENVAWAARIAAEQAGITEPLAGPVRVSVVFTMPKPVSAPKRRRTWPAVKPDVDKLQRALFDALTTAGVWSDDARVIDVHAVKAYPSEHPQALTAPGVHVRIWPVTA